MEVELHIALKSSPINESAYIFQYRGPIPRTGEWLRVCWFGEEFEGPVTSVLTEIRVSAKREGEDDFHQDVVVLIEFDPISKEE